MIRLNFVIWKTGALMRMLTDINTLLGANTPHFATMSIRAGDIIILQEHVFWTTTNVTFWSIITIVRAFVLEIAIFGWKNHKSREPLFSKYVECFVTTTSIFQNYHIKYYHRFCQRNPYVHRIICLV